MKGSFFLQSEDVAEKPYHYTVCGLSNIYLLNGFTIEEYDGETGVSVHDVEGLHKAIARHVAVHRKGLEPKEVLFLRKTLDMTQAELATKIGCDVQTVARWEKGNCQIPGAADRLLRIFVLMHTQAEDDDSSQLLELIRDTIEDMLERDQISTPQARFAFDKSHWEERQLMAA